MVGFADLTLHNPRAFIWDSAHGTRNLNDLTVAPPNFILDWATKINDEGWIVGIGHYGPNWGSSRGFVLVPSQDPLSDVGATSLPFRPELRLRPNPVLNQLTLQLDLADPGPARISIFDVAGREIGLVLEGSLPAGERTLSWRAAPGMPGGVYYARLTTSHGTRSERFVLLR